MTVYALWRYLSDEWELVRLDHSLTKLKDKMRVDCDRWTVPVQYRLTIEVVFGRDNGRKSAFKDVSLYLNEIALQSPFPGVQKKFRDAARYVRAMI